MRYGLPPEQPPVTTIRVRMVRTTRATLDGGKTVREFAAGEEYDLPEWLAEAFFKGGEGDPAEAYAGLDSEGEATQTEAATAATEQQDEAGGRTGEDDGGAEAPRAERRPRRPRRLHGE
jgi:hypothetical protein